MKVKSWFRPIYEFNAFIGWSIATVGILLSSFPFKWTTSLFLVAMAIYRWASVEKMVRFRLRLSTKYLQLIDSKDLYKKIDESSSKNCFYLGEGYQWEPGITQVCTDILRMPKSDIPQLPSWIPDPIMSRFMPKNVIEDRLPIDIGRPWIKALSETTGPVNWPFKAAEGHTLIAGTTGAGKTRTYEVISTQIIRKGAVLIIIDPKNDFEWKQRVALECERTGRKFLYFKQAEPNKSIRLDPLANWNQSSEIATRISQLMEEGPFRSFAHLFIDRVVKAELYVGDRSNLRSIFGYVQGMIDTLLQRCLVKYFEEQQYPEYEMKAKSTAPKNAQSGYLDGLIGLYTSYCIDKKTKEGINVECEPINGLMSTYKHDKEHYSKIIATLLPLMQMLSTGETGLMLAPNIDDILDEREIWDTQQVIDQDAVLYIGMDSLSNSEVAKAVNSMILADIASVAGHIYNFVREKDRKEIFVVIDEVAEAINEQVIQVLNKGRGAGFRAFVALQSIKDLEAKLGSAPKMLQVLANLNNQLVLRLEDTETAKWIIDKVGETGIKSVNTSYSQGTATEQHVGEFSGNISRSQSQEIVSLVPIEILFQLPNLQYISRFTGGHISMGTIPIIKD